MYLAHLLHIPLRLAHLRPHRHPHPHPHPHPALNIQKNIIIKDAIKKHLNTKKMWLEKYLVKYIKQAYSSIKNKYDEIYLIRNEKHFKIFSFDEGLAFEPDFVLFLSKSKSHKNEIYSNPTHHTTS